MEFGIFSNYQIELKFSEHPGKRITIKLFLPEDQKKSESSDAYK